MAATMPMAVPAGMALSRRQTLARPAAIASIVVEMPGAHLVMWWPEAEQELRAEQGRAKVLAAIATSTSEEASSQSKPCVHGPPSFTLGHILEKFLGSRPKLPAFWQGVSRSCGDAALGATDLQQMPALLEALTVCGRLLQAYKDSARTTSERIVFTDAVAGSKALCLAEVKVVKGWGIVDVAQLSGPEKLRRLNLLAFAKETTRAGARKEQDMAALLPSDELTKAWEDACRSARAAFQVPVAPTAAMESNLVMCAAQQAFLEPPRQDSAAAARSSTEPSKSFAPLTSIVSKAGQLLQIPGGLANAKKVLEWVRKALGTRDPESVEVKVLQQSVEVADVWVEMRLAEPCPTKSHERECELERLRGEIAKLKAEAQQKDEELHNLRQEIVGLKARAQSPRGGSAGCESTPPTNVGGSKRVLSPVGRSDPLARASAGSPHGEQSNTSLLMSPSKRVRV